MVVYTRRGADAGVEEDGGAGSLSRSTSSLALVLPPFTTKVSVAESPASLASWRSLFSSPSIFFCQIWTKRNGNLRSTKTRPSTFTVSTQLKMGAGAIIVSNRSQNHYSIWRECCLFWGNISNTKCWMSRNMLNIWTSFELVSSKIYWIYWTKVLSKYIKYIFNKICWISGQVLDEQAAKYIGHRPVLWFSEGWSAFASRSLMKMT